MTTADRCRSNRWTPGTLLVGEDGGVTCAVRLTAVGEATVLARLVATHDGEKWRRETCGEGMWVLGGGWNVPSPGERDLIEAACNGGKR